VSSDTLKPASVIPNASVNFQNPLFLSSRTRCSASGRALCFRISEKCSNTNSWSWQLSDSKTHSASERTKLRTWLNIPGLETTDGTSKGGGVVLYGALMVLTLRYSVLTRIKPWQIPVAYVNREVLEIS
jgi:hypothetical protein